MALRVLKAAMALRACHTARAAPLRQRCPPLRQRCARAGHRAASRLPARAGGADDLVDRLAQFVTSSPLNELKKAAARAQAGDYDAERVRARLDGLICDTDILLLSFPS